ncbi:MAG: DUF4239 domain-containing protein [Deltaproteobacteria bacterium]|nr:DUF4239 domain-containing protein [Deltaproteobacteria bacterium]
MIVDWIYGNPTWLWGTVLVALSTVLACCGLLIFHRLVHVDIRRAHNDLAGFTIAVVGVLYAVLLAFIAIATWEAFSNASDIVESESDYAGGIYFDTQGLPQAKGQPIRDAIAGYVSTVINQEWPMQRAGKTPNQAWKPLRDLNTAIATIQPQNLGEAMIQAELLNSWNKLYLTRSSRLSAVPGHIPDVVWWIVFLGAAITTGYTYFFGYHSLGMHMAMTGTLAATLALVVVLIIDLDRPFRGEISVTPEPFVMTQQSWSRVSLDSGSKFLNGH